jgi:hypothetical protein
MFNEDIIDYITSKYEKEIKEEFKQGYEDILKKLEKETCFEFKRIKFELALEQLLRSLIGKYMTIDYEEVNYNEV